MTAKLATVDEHILAGTDDACGISDGSLIARDSGDKQQTGGMQFDCGYLSPFFVTDPERMEVAFENAYVLIHQGKISSRKDLLPLLEQMTKIGNPLLIIAEDIESEALATLVVNKLRGPLQIAAVKAPGVGDERKRMLRELAVIIGSKSIGEEINIQMRNMQISDLGLARKITIDKDRTWIEGRAQYNQLSFEPGARIPSNGHSSQEKSSGTAIYSSSNERPSGGLSPSPETRCRRDVSTACANPAPQFTLE
jgi:chaperonin GroEL (HSP60 family)